MGYGHSSMMNSVPLLVLAFATVLAAPSGVYDDYIEKVPQKRAALVLDRLLIALRKALSEGEKPQTFLRLEDRDGPRTAPLRITEDELNDMALQETSSKGVRPQGYQQLGNREGSETALLRIAEADLNDNMSSLERRGQTNPGRGRVLRCYFNAVTCF